MSRTGFAKDQLLSFIQRVERMEEEKKAIADDIKEIFAEARGTGFDVKIMKRVIAFRKMEKADFQEYDAMLDLYMEAVGFDHTPLGKVTTPAPKAAKAPLPAHDADTGELIEDSQAKAVADAPAKATTQSAAGEETVSRGADARSSAETAEIYGRDSAERRAPSPPKPSYDVIGEIPSFLLREQPPRQPSA